MMGETGGDLGMAPIGNGRAGWQSASQGSKPQAPSGPVRGPAEGEGARRTWLRRFSRLNPEAGLRAPRRPWACPTLAIAYCFAVVAVSGQCVLTGSVHPVAATVSLIDGRGHTSTSHAKADGTYRFTSLSAGTYTVRAEMAGYTAASVGPFVLVEKESKQVDLTLAATTAEFFDEPNFVVAGVTDTNNRGGHGSDSVVRSTETLARAAASLGDIAEKQGNALEAVREYQHAAELNPSENNLFDWGTELLTHRAAEQAMEVFAKGNRLFPQSARMLLGLGAALYARGSYDKAALRFFGAADLNPADPGPYLFLGKVQSPEIAQLDGYMERLARFAAQQPDNALANYYYAVSVWKRWKGPDDRATAERAELLLAKTVRLDPTLADAWLELGMVHSSLLDFAAAIAAYQRAIEAGTQREEAHYRLGQAYQRTGETVKAREEFDLYEKLRKTAAEEEERERSEIQQFVFTLRQ